MGELSSLGKVLDGHYQIMRQLGRGMNGALYLAVDQTIHRRWVIKEITEKNIAEADILMRLHHPGIIGFKEIIYGERKRYMVLEYIEGQSLEQLLCKDIVRITEHQVVNWAIELAGILQYLHGLSPPILHCDIKPGNIMILPNQSLKLIDFGIAGEAGCKEHFVKAYGSVGFAAPEQYGDHEGYLQHEIDSRTDLYAFGQSFRYVLHHSKVPGNILLQIILRHCVHQCPRLRFGNAGRLKSTLMIYQRLCLPSPIQRRRRTLGLTGLLWVLLMLSVRSGFETTVERAGIVKTEIDVHSVTQTEEPLSDEVTNSLPKLQIMRFWTNYEEMKSELQEITKTYLDAECSIEKYDGLLQICRQYEPFRAKNEAATLDMIKLLETGARELEQEIEEADTIKPDEVMAGEVDAYKRMLCMYDQQLFMQYRFLGQMRLQSDQTGALTALNQAVGYGEAAKTFGMNTEEEQVALREALISVYSQLGDTAGIDELEKEN